MPSGALGTGVNLVSSVGGGEGTGRPELKSGLPVVPLCDQAVPEPLEAPFLRPTDSHLIRCGVAEKGSLWEIAPSGDTSHKDCLGLLILPMLEIQRKKLCPFSI